jgi:hypothetical protein
MGHRMATPPGFWSYVRGDDEAEGGRIVRLARDLEEQFEMLTGESIELLFLDQESLKWGEDWQKKIDEAIQGLTFFIPVLTPRYFQSVACRRELQGFARSARDLGISELILPIIYVEFTGLHEESPADDLVGLIRTYQYVDWTDLRFAEPTSSEYRRAVASLAARLTESNRAADAASLASPVEPNRGTLEVDEGPGLLDILVTATPGLLELGGTIEALGQEVQRITEIVNQDTLAADLDSVPEGQEIAARLLFARRIARDLQEPAERISSLGNTFASQLRDADSIVRAIAGFAPFAGPGQLTEFSAGVRTAATSARGLSETLQQALETTRPIESMSRDLRVPFRLIRQGLTAMVEGRSITDNWLRLIGSID